MKERISRLEKIMRSKIKIFINSHLLIYLLENSATFLAFEYRILVDSIFTNNHKFKKVILSTNNTVGLKCLK